MKKTTILVLVAAVLMIGSTTVSSPEANISNELIRANLYLPDAQNGYYRGSRFDWSGQISSLKWKNHEYFGQWFKEYSPTLHDAIQGPVEAFDPIGYDQAKPGEGFVKIGIGVVSRLDDGPVTFSKYYPVTNTGKWNVDKGKDQIKFTHTLTDKVCSYLYEKVITLSKGKPEMTISHTLKNTGPNAFETSCYNHNFFVIDGQPTGTGFTINFPFTYGGPVDDDMTKLVAFSGNTMSYKKDLEPKERVFFRDMTAGAVAPYAIEIENHKTGAAVKITGDQPISKFVYWSASTTVCPEPYISIKLNSGQEISWSIRYEFYECSKN